MFDLLSFCQLPNTIFILTAYSQ